MHKVSSQNKKVSILFCLGLFSLGLFSIHANAGGTDPDDAYFRIYDSKSVAALDDLLLEQNWHQIFENFSPQQSGWDWTRLDPQSYKNEGVSIGFRVQMSGTPVSVSDENETGSDAEEAAPESDESSSLGFWGWAKGAMVNAVSGATNYLASAAASQMMRGKLVGDITRSEFQCPSPYARQGYRFDVELGRSSRQIKWFINRLAVHLCLQDTQDENKGPYRRIMLKTLVDPGKWYPGVDHPIVKEFLASQLEAWGKALYASPEKN